MIEHRLDILRRRINDEKYIHAAVHRLALVMSKELMDINTCKASMMLEGGENERQRKRRK